MAAGVPFAQAHVAVTALYRATATEPYGRAITRLRQLAAVRPAFGGRIPAAVKDAIHTTAAGIRDEIKRIRRWRNLHSPLRASPEPLADRIATIFSALVEAQYDRCVFRRGEDHSVVVSIGEPGLSCTSTPIWGNWPRERYPIGRAYTHELTVPLRWLSRVRRLDMACLRLAGDRALVLDAEHLGNGVARVTYVRQGRGYTLDLRRNVYIHPGRGGTWHMHRSSAFDQVLDDGAFVTDAESPVRDSVGTRPARTILILEDELDDP
jgi:hypothetical protein